MTVCIFSIIVLLLFNLIFLPRTSLDRDLRRLHGEYLTYDDCTRLYLTHLTMKNNIDEYMEFHEEELHMPGENYEATMETLKEFKFKSSAEKYETWLARPLDSYLKLYAGKKLVYDADLKETELFSFYPYSANGFFSGKYIFANHGTDEDFAALAAANVTMKGRIVILRNGLAYPSIKVHNAELNGAKGAVIYSDPYDDGAFRKSNGFKEFPHGPARNSYSIQKETLNRILEQPGDPSTPGWSSTLFAKRVKPDTIPQIPVVPISYNSIKPILASLDEGPDLGWKGDYEDFHYTPGTSNNTLELGNKIQFKIKPIYNIVTNVKGIIEDEEIIVGASRDVIGGIGGSSSGFASLMEMARGFNELAKKGWRPLRTIKLISWDGSSYGLLGSTEFGEFYAHKLTKNALIYINLDGVRGTEFLLESNPIFNSLLRDSMRQIRWNDEISLYQYFKSQQNGTAIPLISQRIGDYSVFQSHLGVPSVNIGFSNRQNIDPVPYDNSKYDSLAWLSSFDESLRIPSVVAQFAGYFVLQMSEKEIVHVHTKDYLTQIEHRFKRLCTQIPESWLNKRVMMDPKKNSYDNPTVYMEVKKISDQLEQLVNVHCVKFDATLESLQRQILKDYPWFKLYVKIRIAIQIKMASIKVRELDKLFVAESEFTRVDDDTAKDGLLRRRKWFQHLIFAPDTKTGKHLELLPGLTEGVRDEDLEVFTRNLAALDIALQKVVKKLK